MAGQGYLRDAPLWLLIQRLPVGIDVRRLNEAAWRCTSALCAGRPLEEAIEDASAIDVSMLLAKHLATGTFVAFSLAEPVYATQRSERFP